MITKASSPSPSPSPLAQRLLAIVEELAPEERVQNNMELRVTTTWLFLKIAVGIMFTGIQEGNEIRGPLIERIMNECMTEYSKHT